MMMLSSLIIFQVSIVVLLMSTFTTTSNIPQPTSLIAEMSQSYNDEQNPSAVFPDHQNLSPSSKQMILTGDDSLSDEEYENDYSKTIWPQFINKRYVNKVIRGGSTHGGDSRIWPIPYRFGKRAAMPYRFGKRADMHFRIGKRSASL